jgi:hypothetical protein
MTPDDKKKRWGATNAHDQFVDDIRAKLERQMEKLKKKGIEPKPGKLTIIKIDRKPGAPDWRDKVEEALAERRLPPRTGPHPSKLIDMLVRNHLGPWLKGLGYRKNARRFWRDHGEIVDVITVWKHEHNDAWEGGLGIQLGVHWKKHQRELGGHFAAEEMPPKNCLLTEWLDVDATKDNARWRKFKPDIDIETLAREIISKIEKGGFPWLQSRHDPRYIREYLAKNRERFLRIAKYDEEIRAAREKKRR